MFEKPLIAVINGFSIFNTVIPNNVNQKLIGDKVWRKSGWLMVAIATVSSFIGSTEDLIRGSP